MLEIPEGFYAITAYTNGYVIIIEGQPPEGMSLDDPLAHNCDAMGCGVCHVVARIPVLEPMPELEWARRKPPPPSVPSWEADK